MLFNTWLKLLTCSLAIIRALLHQTAAGTAVCSAYREDLQLAAPLHLWFPRRAGLTVWASQRDRLDLICRRTGAQTRGVGGWGGVCRSPFQAVYLSPALIKRLNLPRVAECLHQKAQPRGKREAGSKKKKDVRKALIHTSRRSAEEQKFPSAVMWIVPPRLPHYPSKHTQALCQIRPAKKISQGLVISLRDNSAIIEFLPPPLSPVASDTPPWRFVFFLFALRNWN